MSWPLVSVSTSIVTVIVVKSHFGSVVGLLVKGSRGARGATGRCRKDQGPCAVAREDGFKRPDQ